MPAYIPTRHQLFLGTIAEERRALNRARSENSDEYKITVSIRGKQWPARVINLHCAGACIECERLTAWNGDVVDDLTIYYGKRALVTLDRVRWTWRSGSRAGFILGAAQACGTSGLITVKPHFEPTLCVPDPIKPDWMLFGRVSQISEECLRFRTSLSNRHLLPGTLLQDSIVRLPCLPDVVLQLRIANIEVECHQLGVVCGFSRPGRSHRRSLHQFSLFGLESGGGTALYRPQDRARESSAPGPGLRIEILSSGKDYREVLEIREAAYRDAGIIAESVTSKDFADEYDRRSIVIVARLNGRIIGTARLIRVDEPGQQFPFEDDVPAAALGPDSKYQYFETSRLAIHPDFQNTEVVLRLFQELGRQTILANRSAAALARTNQRKSYMQLGWEPVGREIPHPLLTGQTLQLMKLSQSKFLSGRNRSATAFELVVSPVIAALEYANVIHDRRLLSGRHWRFALEQAVLRALSTLRNRTAVQTKPPRVDGVYQNSTRS